MTVLVTGALGYLGSRLVRELPRYPEFADETIRMYDNFRQPRYQTLWDLPAYGEYEFVEGDIRDAGELEAAMQGVDTVFHLAAITNASETFDIPDKTWDVNYRGAMNVFEAAKAADVHSFVNISTCSVYGRTEHEITEAFECEPESPYGEAKVEAEREMLNEYDGEMDLTALRLGTVYGWTTGMRFDTVVNKFSLLAATDSPLTVYEGAEEQERPYLHVQDAVRSMIFAAQVLGDGSVYNVVGQNASVNDVVTAIENNFANVTVGYTQAEQLDQLSYIVSDEKITAEGFETAYTLDTGVAEMAQKFATLG